MNWEFIIANAGGWLAAIPLAVGAIWALYVYVSTRSQELALKRTEYILQLKRQFHDDQIMEESTAVIEGRHPSRSVDDFVRIASSQGPLSEADLVVYLRFEKFLSFLWTLSYAHLELRTLSARDLNAFGYWFDRVCKHDGLRTYCQSNGYEEILRAGAKLPN